MSDLLLLAAGAVVLGSYIVGHIDAHHSSTEREINRALGLMAALIDDFDRAMQSVEEAAAGVSMRNLAEAWAATDE
jgi:hypothetical protein